MIEKVNGGQSVTLTSPPPSHATEGREFLGSYAALRHEDPLNHTIRTSIRFTSENGEIPSIAN